MSGRRIDDHSSWVGKSPKNVPFPDGAKMKQMSSAEGAGHVGSSYPDTEEMVKRDQDHGIRKAESHKMKPGYRY